MSTCKKEDLIPQVSPLLEYLEDQIQIDQAISDVLKSGSYILGDRVKQFEDDFSDYLGFMPGSVIGVANGTDALVLSLRALGVTPGDAVIIPSHTANAVASAVVQCGAVPLFADIDEESFGLSSESVKRILFQHSKSLKVGAIITVHMYGSPAELSALRELASVNRIPLIEDCSQAHGAIYHGAQVGTFGDIATFSFYPTKNLAALGDGGAIATRNTELNEKIRLLRQYGWKTRYYSDVHGYNSRLDEVQAAVLTVKLKKLDSRNERRREIAQSYRGVVGLAHPTTHKHTKHVYHQYVVRTSNRVLFQESLLDAGVQTGIHYPTPLHLQPAFAEFGKWIVDLSITEKISPEIVSLPMYPGLSPLQLDRIVSALESAS